MIIDVIWEKNLLYYLSLTATLAKLSSRDLSLFLEALVCECMREAQGENKIGGGKIKLLSVWNNREKYIHFIFILLFSIQLK